MTKVNKNIASILSGIIIVIIFIIISFLLQYNSAAIEGKFNSGFFGILLYLFITTLATVIAPISAVPLLPVAVFLWGPFMAAIYSIIGWSIGSIIAFTLARKYGVRIVKKFVPIDKISKYESYIPQEDLFLSIVIMRIFLPVDILSYLLGIFSKVDLLTYSIATFIGVMPFAFILAYLGSLPFLYQALSFVIGGIIFIYLFFKLHRKYMKKQKSSKKIIFKK